MASVITHTAVPLGLSLALGTKIIPRPLLLAGIAGSVLPDLDAIGFWLGVPYGSVLGHRGLTHSIVFAVATGAVAAALRSRLMAGPSGAFLFILISTASHGCLDALTNGGLGIAFFSPVTNHRYFLPWRVLEVSPIGIHPGTRGIAIAWSELRYVWLPCLAVGLLGSFVRRSR